MPLIEINHNPSPKELRWTGLLLALFCAMIGGLIWLNFGVRTIAFSFWGSGIALALLFYAIPPIQRHIYLGWIYLAFPIGWVISHLLLGLIFFGVITPIGLIMRLLGKDPMHRRFHPGAQTYWITRDPQPPSERYFRQF